MSEINAAVIAREAFGIDAEPEPLPGERDLNFRVDGWVLKVHHPDTDPAVLDLQDAALAHLGVSARRAQHAGRPVRLVPWVTGQPIAAPLDPAQMAALGALVARTDRALADFTHPAMKRATPWDLRQAGLEIDFAGLPHQVIHNDANELNVLLGDDGLPAALIDFGDVVWTARVCGLAIAAAYAMQGHADPLGAVLPLIAAYDAVTPLTVGELAVLYPLIRARLEMSIRMAALGHERDPANEYLQVSQAGVRAVLDALAGVDPDAAHVRLRRDRVMSRALSLSYAQPLQIVRGEGAHLYDAEGREWLDLVNNVAHVGHCHPRVVAAGQAQMARLNTNTRYLHDSVVTYAERLGATLPDPLRVVFCVNSGSEANDLALRLARAHTRARDVLVLEHAYHGHLSSLIDLSPYKAPPPPGTEVLPIGGRVEGDTPLAAFFAEAIPGCAGQVVLPDGFLRDAYAAARARGAVCVADEVQSGLGRVGSHFWAFEREGVVPDIVTIGKPAGNGHPLAAVLTTPAIAASFETGMEYFNTFGGNPVSAEIGLAVLDVIADERLQAHAATLGDHLLTELRRLDVVDARGAGLFLGVELGPRAPAVKEALKAQGILISTDGPDDSVLKIKPPLVIERDDADRFLEALATALG